MTMTDQAIADFLAPGLRRKLSASGLKQLSVRSSEDHDGSPLLILDTFFQGRGHPVDTQAIMSAMTEARHALASAGEHRFLHLQLHIPDADESVAA